MKKLLFALLVAPLLTGCQDKAPAIRAKVSQSPKTFCNPINLNYRFMKIDGGEGIREAADPVVVTFNDRYYLFASKSSGYWHSDNFTNWQHVFITDSVLPIEDYAPGLFVHNGYLYYVGSTRGKGMLYRSAYPEKGEWEPVKEIWSYWDPAFYVEGDKLYMYYGCSPEEPIYGQVLDLNTLEATSEVFECFNSDIVNHGWERTGELNELPQRPYVEGAWMTAHAGKYYLQYAAPGTEWKSYADGVYVASSPTGPFTYVENNPVSYKPTGFIGGAGHGCLFTVGDSNYWKAATNAISVCHMFERRISLFPSGFDADGNLFTETYLGDYPMYLPTVQREAGGLNQPEWMLLSYGKPMTSSTALRGHAAFCAVDEEARSYWVAETNTDEEWMMLNLINVSSVHAIQINFAEYGAKQKGFAPDVYQSYELYASMEGLEWTRIADYSTKRTDTPHDYIEFEEPFQARYIKFKNVAYTVSDHLSVRDFRVFGKGMGNKPAAVNDFTVVRSETDPCKVTLSWDEVPEVQGYLVRYGISKDKLHANFQVLYDTTLEIGSLNKGVTYYFTIDAYNENGVTRTELVKEVL